MIIVYRYRVATPKFFSSKECEVSKNELAEFYVGQSKRKRAQKRFANFNFPQSVGFALNELFNGKCAYCESTIEQNDLNRFIDHFRPRYNAKGLDSSAAYLDHYWWLTYEWANLYLSCLECKKMKSTWFPVEGKRAKTQITYDTIIQQETNLIIDPCNDEIEKHLRHDYRTGKLIPLTKKGETSIEILKLNRRKLVNGRFNAIQNELSNWENVSNSFLRTKKMSKNEIIYHWEELISKKSKIEFLGARRALLLNKLTNNKGIATPVEFLFNSDNDVFPAPETEDYLTKPISKDVLVSAIEKFEKAKSISNQYVSEIKDAFKNVYLDRIELRNYKCFDYLNISLSEKSKSEKEPWLVFLGENGVGKSSLIKAVAIALMGQKYLDSLNLDSSKILKFGKRTGYIKVFGSRENEVFEVKFNKNSTKLTSNIIEPPCYLLGYGSTRLLPKGSLTPESKVTYIKSKNLFDYSISLSDVREWLLEVPPKMFNQVAISLKDLLLLEPNDIIRRNKKSKAIYISYAKAKNRIDIEELSDGYKSIFAITVDIIQTLSKDNLAFEVAEAIVLIDEIGTHLHPRWKMEVVNRLRKTFPKIQFIVTTHEPLCLRGLEKNEVLVLKRNDKGKIIAINDLPNPSDFRVDQLLTSEYFGLNSTLDFETEALFKEYYDLLAKEDRSNEEQNRVYELNQLLPSKKHIGDDIRDELVYYVIDELLAKQVKREGFKMANDEIKKEALDRVKDIWNFIDNND